MPTFNTKENKVKSNFSRISISLASPEDISARSCGEVLKPETVNYRTYKPERDGLFCEKIFGPTKDYECYCGKYKRIRYRGIVCDRCGVEVTEKKVRRERMGHIALTVPVAHIWYFKSAPNKISALLGLPSKKLESVIYYEKYIVVNPGASGVEKMELLSEDEYLDVLARIPDNDNLPDGDPNKFTGVRVDGRLIPAGNYSVIKNTAEGTTTVGLYPGYLATLAYGKHSIDIVFTDGFASAEFSVLNASASPKTGDTNNLALWAGVLVLSGAAVVALIPKKRKQ